MENNVKVPILWTCSKAEAEVGISRFTLMCWIKSGKVKYIRVGAGKRGKILINAQSLCDYMAGGEQA